MDPEFPRSILGDHYVNATLDYIESGDPMSIYKQEDEFNMSMRITINNIWFAFLTFSTGFFAGLGSFFHLIRTAVMVGAFQYFFFSRGVFLESFLTIWTHGTIEISAIIIAAAAGFTVSKGLFFPGSLTRLQALQISARRGVKIMLGTIPLFIMAGFIEGYLTRHTETPDIIRASFILLCLAFIVMYFIWLPWKRGREGVPSSMVNLELPSEKPLEVSFTKIRSVGEIFTDTFIFYKKYFVKIVSLAVAMSIFFCATVFLFSSESPAETFIYSNSFLEIFSVLASFFSNETIPYLYLLNTIIFSILTFLCFKFLIDEYYKDSLDVNFDSKFYLLHFIQILVIVLGFVYVVNIQEDFLILNIIIAYRRILIPILILWLFINFKERIDLFTGLGRTLFLIKGNFWKSIGLFSVMGSMAFLFLFIFHSFIFKLLSDFIGMNVSLDQESMNHFTTILNTFFATSIIFLVYPLIVFSIGLLYFSCVEQKDALHLKEQVKNIGKTKTVQGMVREA